MTLLHIEGLHFQREQGSRTGSPFAVEVESLDLDPGQAIGIVGPSGCGKSTLIDLFALLRRPTSVLRFLLQNVDIAELWKQGDADACSALRAEQIGVVLQTGGLLPCLPVRENILLGQRLLDRLDSAWADTLIESLDLVGLADRLPAQLSIGQRQRVAVARALAHRPALVLADEPTASLGIDHAPAVMDLLLSLARDEGAGVIVVSHDRYLLQDKRVPIRCCALHDHVVHLEASA